MNRIFFNIKVCGEELHREGFLDGNLFMNRLDFFKKYEEDQAANIGIALKGLFLTSCQANLQ